MTFRTRITTHPIVQKFTGGGFAHKVMLMLMGTAAGQLAAVLASPILTRLYTPEMFAVLGAFSSIITIAAVVASLRLEMAIPLAKDAGEERGLFRLNLLALIVTTIVFALLVWLLSGEGVGGISLGLVDDFAAWLVVGFVAVGLYQILVYVATHHDRFDLIARTRLYQGLAGPASQIGFGIAGFGAAGLVIGFIISQSVGAVRLLKELIWRHPVSEHERARIERGIQPSPTGEGEGECVSRTHNNDMDTGLRRYDGSLQSLAQRYRRFPLISSPIALLYAAGNGLFLFILLPILYPAKIAGFVFLTERVIGRPLLMVSTSILQVFIGEAAKIKESNPAELKRRFLQLVKVQGAIVAFWLLLINAAAPFVFGFVFGTEWIDAVPYLQVLSLSYLPVMTMRAVVHVMQILERQWLFAAWEIMRTILVVGAVLLAWSMGLDAWTALLYYSITQAVAQIALFFLMLWCINNLNKETDYAK